MDCIIPTKDKQEMFMRLVYLVAEYSKDRTKIGAVLVRDQNIIASGYNGFPRKVMDYNSRYKDAETKYAFVVHAEANAILSAARLGVNTLDSTLYTCSLPCSECTKSIIQAGIKKIVCHAQYPNHSHNEKWIKSFEISKTMIGEAGVHLSWFDKKLGLEASLRGEKVLV